LPGGVPDRDGGHLVAVDIRNGFADAGGRGSRLGADLDPVDAQQAIQQCSWAEVEHERWSGLSGSLMPAGEMPGVLPGAGVVASHHVAALVTACDECHAG